MVNSSQKYSKRGLFKSHYFIKKAFQGKFILRFCLLVVLLVISVSLPIYIIFDSIINKHLAMPGSRYVHILMAFKEIQDTLFSTITFTAWDVQWVLIVLIALAVLLEVLLVSHKVAGPLYRLEKGLAAVGRGDFRHIVYLRAKDQLVELANSFNQMTRGLHDKMGKIKRHLTETDSSREKLEELLKRGTDSKEDLRAVIKRIRSETENLEEILKDFKMK